MDAEGAGTVLEPERRTGRASRWLAVASSGFVALTAIGGGLELVAGWPRAQPLGWLDGTPFDSYLVPGLLLGGLVGGTSAVAAGMAATRSGSWPRCLAVAGAVLTGWTAVEVAMLDQPDAPTPIEWFYGGLGLAMIGLGAAGRAAAGIEAGSR